MDPETTATLGEPDFPPKNGIIIKQGDMFVQETKKLLFMKWKVWRKRFITLRYLSRGTSPVLQIDSRNGVIPSQVLLHLSGNSTAEMVDFSGPQDLASAKVLQLIAKEQSEPIVFKHASQDEMTDWVAAFKLTIALGETGSICSDTDSSTWAGSQAAASPLAADFPDSSFTYGTVDAPVFYAVRILSCTLPSHQDLLIDQDYSLQVSHTGITLQEKSVQTGDICGGSRSWPMSSIRKIFVETQSSSGTDSVRLEIFRPSKREEGIILLQTSSAADLCQRVKILTANNVNLKKSLENSVSSRSSTTNRRPLSERSKKRPFIGVIGPQHSKLSFDQLSPVLGRTRRPSSREDSVKALRNKRVGNFKQMDSRESTGSSGELNAGPASDPISRKPPPLLAQISFGGNTADHEGCGS